MIDLMEFSKDITRFLNEDQYLKRNAKALRGCGAHDIILIVIYRQLHRIIIKYKNVIFTLSL